jgi:hypothetical protein
MENPKIYLGDSVYAEFDGFGIWLTTNNGYPDDPRNKIYLEPQIVHGLSQFLERAPKLLAVLNPQPDSSL